MEVDHHWKTTFYSRQPLMEDNLLIKDDPRLNITFDAGKPLMHKTFYGRHPLMEDDL